MLPVRLFDSGRLARRFHRLHRQRYGHASPGQPVEVVNLRLKTIGATDKPDFRPEPEEGPDVTHALVRQVVTVVFAGGTSTDTPIYEREQLRPGNRVTGPAVVVQMDATTVILPGWQARVDAYCNLILTPC